MLVINVNSQLGNQMFQYALYRKLRHLGRKVKLDLQYYQQRPKHYGLDIFGLQPDIATTKEISISKDEYRSIFSRLRRKFFGKRKSIVDEIHSNIMNFNSKVFDLKTGYLYGYWQSEKYFSDIRSTLLQEFQFPVVNDIKNKELLKTIQSSISVSIHVRRGDYIGGFPLMSEVYYQNAMNYFMEKYGNIFFVVFSNDVAWCKSNIKFNNGVYVDWNNGKDSWKDMYLMTQCKHNIIANSSFSWWGAWLNQNQNKVVIAPNKWFYHKVTPDIYCENWRTIKA